MTRLNSPGKKVVIFGTRDTAELAHYYLESDSDHRVVGFSVHGDYVDGDQFRGLPVVPFENVQDAFSPRDHVFLAPMTGANMNRDRESVYQQIRARGYTLTSYISSRATVLSDRIGDNCFILEDNTIQPFTVIGNNTMLWSGNHIGHHSRIDDHVFVTSHAVVSGHCHIQSYSFIGVNAAISHDVVIAEGTFVGMNCSITRSTEPWSVYHGHSARKAASRSTDIKL